MAKRTSIQESADFYSDKLSETVRTLSLGVIAVVWLFIAGGDDTPVLPSAPDSRPLIAALVLAFVALVLDYLHYVVGYRLAKHLLVMADSTKLPDVQFNSSSAAFRWRTRFFWWKQFAALAAVGVMVWSLVSAFR